MTGLYVRSGTIRSHYLNAVKTMFKLFFIRTLYLFAAAGILFSSCQNVRSAGSVKSEVLHPFSLVSNTVNLVDTNERFYLFRGENRSQNYAYASLLPLDKMAWIVIAAKQTAFGDFNSSELVLKRSQNGGKTWGPETIVQPNIGKVNVSMPSLVKVNSKLILLFFLVKNSVTDSKMFFKKSTDGGITWSAPAGIPVKIKGYYVCNNDRVILTTRNRIIIPVAYAGSIWVNYEKQVVKCILSDDLGKTWHVSSTLNLGTSPLMEPGVEQLADGSILMVIRSKTGYVLFSSSSDGGNSWSNLSTSVVKTPEAPQTVRRIPGTDSLVMVYINTPYIPAINFNNRKPLAIALSTDNGKSWPRIINIEEGPANFLYPTLAFSGNQMILTYAVNPGGADPEYLKIMNLSRKDFFKPVK